MIPTTATHEHLADTFERVLVKWLGPFTVQAIKNENQTLPDFICASHDYIDANVAMALAFRAVTRRNIDLQSPADIEIWNAGWRVFRQRKY